MRVYLDNNATTPVHPAVLDALQEALTEVYGNASSIHKEGQTARRRIEDARESVARLIGASSREVVFTSGGTESNNAAIFGAVPSSGRHHIVTTAIEHPSVVDVEALGVDTLSISAHKLHAPKGIGALYARKGLALERYLFGGSQERRRRAGTENVPLAIAFGVAAEVAAGGAFRSRIEELRN